MSRPDVHSMIVLIVLRFKNPHMYCESEVLPPFFSRDPIVSAWASPSTAPAPAPRRGDRWPGPPRGARRANGSAPRRGPGRWTIGSSPGGLVELDDGLCWNHWIGWENLQETMVFTIKYRVFLSIFPSSNSMEYTGKWRYQMGIWMRIYNWWWYI